MNKIQALGIPKIKALGLGSSRDIVNPQQKSITIKYISSTIDEKFINLSFVVTQTNLVNFKAKVYVQEMNATNEVAVNKIAPLKNVKEQQITVSFNKDKQFDRYIWQDGFLFQATITCDGVSEETEEFPLKFVKPVIEKVKTCYCDRDFKVGEIENIVEEIRDNTFYTIDGVQYPISKLRKKLFNRNDEPSQKYDTELVPEKDQTNEKLTEVLNKHFKKYNVTKCIQKIHFLGQMYTETEYFTKTVEGTSENLDYDPYRGRGFMHLTGIKNYTAFKVDNNIDILDPNYGKVSKDIDLAAHTAAWFWSVRSKVEFNEPKNKEKYKDILGLTINDLALFEDKYIDRICKIVNGGSNAINERKTNYLTFKNIFNYEKCINKK